MMVRKKKFRKRFRKAYKIYVNPKLDVLQVAKRKYFAEAKLEKNNIYASRNDLCFQCKSIPLKEWYWLWNCKFA